MCKKRDIILVDNYQSQGTTVGTHSFVVLEDNGGEIKGLPFDMICNVLSSFKSANQKVRKLSYPGNFPITASDSSVPGGNTKDGYIKADQFYYFSKDKITYHVIGQMKAAAFNELIDFIDNGDFEIEAILDNL